MLAWEIGKRRDLVFSAIVGSIAGVFVGFFCFAITGLELKQFYHSEDDQMGVSDSYWAGQVFKTDSGYILGGIVIKAFKSGSPAGDLVFSVRETASDLPVGADLCTGTTSMASLSESASDVEISLSEGCNLCPNTAYAFLIHEDPSQSGVYIRGDWSSPTYASGTMVESYDSGSSWSVNSGIDLYFETWGTSTIETCEEEEEEIPLEDFIDFETSEGYSTGNLNGQDGWTTTGFYDANKWNVINSSFYHGSQAIKSASTGIHSTTYLAERVIETFGTQPTISLWWNRAGGHLSGNACKTDPDSFQDIRLYGDETKISVLVSYALDASSTACYVWAKTGGTSYNTGIVFATSTWNNIKIQMKQNSTTTDEFRVGLGSEWSDWYVFNSEDPTDFTDWKIRFESYDRLNDIVDYIQTSYNFSDETDQIEPVIVPTAPEDCEKTLIDSSPMTGTSTGLFYIGDNDATTWDEFKIIFENQSTYGWTSYVATGTWTAGGIYGWSKPYSLATGTYRVFYTLSGKDTDEEYQYYIHSCDGTYIYYTTSTIGTIEWEEEPTFPSEEDCSGYGLSDRLLCEIRNTLRSAFFPNGDKIKELKDNIGSIQDKAPFNYLKATKNFYDTLSADIDSSSTAITIGFFGTSGSVSFDALNGTTSGSSIPILEMIRSIFTFTMTIAFTLLFFNFMKRIFK